jgi:flavin reductase (DIM6/NTAB) family NADH-FMN oxidoreductase RutF
MPRFHWEIGFPETFSRALRLGFRPPITGAERGASFLSPLSSPASPSHHPTTMTQPPESATTPAPVLPSSADAALATALARIPSGLFIVTWRDDDGDHGMLASWVMQAGFSPPALTLAVATGRDLLAAVDRDVRFVVNILGESQRPLLARFGKPAAAGESPFVGLDVRSAPGGAPVLGGSAGWLECRSLGRVGGIGTDHAVVLAEVLAAGAPETEGPLVHVRKNGLRY